MAGCKHPDKKAVTSYKYGCRCRRCVKGVAEDRQARKRRLQAEGKWGATSKRGHGGRGIRARPSLEDEDKRRRGGCVAPHRSVYTAINEGCECEICKATWDAWQKGIWEREDKIEWDSKKYSGASPIKPREGAKVIITREGEWDVYSVAE